MTPGESGARWPLYSSPSSVRWGERQLVRLPFDLSIDLGGGVERSVEHAPARHPVPRPARLVLRNRRRLRELDAAEVEVVRCQRLDVGITGGPTFLEVRHVPSLVGLDSTDCPDDAAH